MYGKKILLTEANFVKPQNPFDRYLKFKLNQSVNYNIHYKILIIFPMKQKQKK